jgi:hypothetical protein
VLLITINKHAGTLCEDWRCGEVQCYKQHSPVDCRRFIISGYCGWNSFKHGHFRAENAFSLQDIRRRHAFALNHDENIYLDI